MTKLDQLLLAASSGALRDGSDTSLAALVAEVRKERARMYRRLLFAAVDRLCWAQDRCASAKRDRRLARALVQRLLRGEPAFGGGK